MTAETPIRRRPPISASRKTSSPRRGGSASACRAPPRPGLRRAVAEEAARRWQEENAEGIRQMNAYVAEHGLPLAKYRLF